MTKKRIKKAPWDFNPATLEQVRAVQALARGEATETQQKKALQWILHWAAEGSTETFVAGQPDVSAYMQGRRSVALQITEILLGKADEYRKPGETDA